MKHAFSLILLVFIISGCFDEDKRIETLPFNGRIEKSIYTHHLFYNLDSAKVVASFTIDTFDLAFDCEPNGWRIFVNSGKKLVSARTGLTNISELTDRPSNTIFGFDSPAIHDSTHIGFWPSTPNEVFVIGRIEDGTIRLKYKFQMLQLDEHYYKFAFASFNGVETVDTAIVYKNNLKRRVLFSFSNPEKELDIEPNKQTWDLLFSSYLDSLPYNNIKLEYEVRGILINKGVEVSVDSTRDYNEINKELIYTFNFSKKQDAIGWDWKYYSISEGTYTILSYRTYIVKSMTGKFFKIKFVGFKNQHLDYGYPKFILEQL